MPKDSAFSRRRKYTHGLQQFIERGKEILPTAYNPNLQKRLHKIDGLEFVPADISEAAPPTVMHVNPSDLWVDLNWQREFRASNIGLIIHILGNFSWWEYKAPRGCIWPDGRIFLMDGRTTATACLHHPQIDKIPILVNEASEEELLRLQANAFVSLNSSQISVPTADKLTAAIFQGEPLALELAGVINKVGLHLIRSHHPDATFKAGDTHTAGTLKLILQRDGAERLERICKLAKQAKFLPIRTAHLNAIRYILREETDKKPINDSALLKAITSIGNDHALAEAQLLKQKDGTSVAKALAKLYLQRYRDRTGKYKSNRTLG